MLAAQAYLRATITSIDQEGASAAYYSKADDALAMQHNMRMSTLQKELTLAVTAADDKFAQIEADETAWAAAGEDLDQKFAAKYYETSSLQAAGLGLVVFGQQLASQAWLIGMVLFLFACVYGLYRWLKADLAEARVNPPRA